MRVLEGEASIPPPVWLMRQAGRYLPEYRELRARAGTFLDFCLTPELAVEATLQPLRRFSLDAAILFSDILVVPHGLGQKVAFEEGRGPILEALTREVDLRRLSKQRLPDALAPVYEAVGRVAAELPREVALIGFAGAPWTVATYMVEGGSSRHFSAVKRWAYGDPGSFSRLVEIVTEATIEHLLRQIDAGANVVQLFDSWVGILPEPELRRWGLTPTRVIVDAVKQRRPTVPIIVFPRGAGLLYRDYADIGASALSLDTTVPLEWAAREVQTRCAVQGNLDPAMLVTGGEALEQETVRILTSLADGPFVFNLGHGILPETPPEHVETMVAAVRCWGGPSAQPSPRV